MGVMIYEKYNKCPASRGNILNIITQQKYGTKTETYLLVTNARSSQAGAIIHQPLSAPMSPDFGGRLLNNVPLLRHTVYRRFNGS